MGFGEPRGRTLEQHPVLCAFGLYAFGRYEFCEFASSGLPGALPGVGNNAMYHFPTCPKCQTTFEIYCDNQPNPFQAIHVDNVMRMLYPKDSHLPRVKLHPPTISQLKMMLLLDILGHDLPELDELADLPDEISNFIDGADEKLVEHMLIQLVGRWDCIRRPNLSNDYATMQMGAKVVAHVSKKK